MYVNDIIFFCYYRELGMVKHLCSKLFITENWTPHPKFQVHKNAIFNTKRQNLLVIEIIFFGRNN